MQELLALGNNNMKMWNIFQWLAKHDELQHGTQAEIIKLYADEQLVAYSLFENYLVRGDKVIHHQDSVYKELGVVHFITLDQYRNKGYASQLANAMYSDIIEPMLATYSDSHLDLKTDSKMHVYVTATGRAAPLMERTDIPAINLIKQFYSDASFETKVANYLAEQACK